MMTRAISDLRGIARRHRLAVTAVALACGLGGFLLLNSGDGDRSGPVSDPAAASAAVLSTLRAVPLPDLSVPPEPEVPGPSSPIARVIEGRTVRLLTRPGGKLISRLDDETEFGSARTFWVAKIHGDWFGVVAPELPDGELGWIRDDRTRLEISRTNYRLVADRSERVLRLYYGNRLLNRYSVTVGRPGSETPLGVFAITDALAGPGLGPYYGCCVLALSGHQPNLPPGWIGGDRMAIHGTPDQVGIAASAGCLRTTDETMVSLFARVPLGAPVFVRA
jgi:L,D-transpeptidase catalytic domain